MSKNLVPTKKTDIVEIKSVLESTVEVFLSSLDVKERTRDSYRKSLKVFQLWIEENKITQLERKDILAYKEYLQEKTFVDHSGEIKNHSALTVSAYLTALRRFFAYLEAEKIYPNVSRDIKGLKRPKGFLKDTLTKEEARRLIDGIKTESLNALRDLALINLMIRTGLRTIEVAMALIGDIGRESGEVVLRIQGKGRDSKDDFVLLTDQTYRPILDYLQARDAMGLQEPLFASHSNRNKTATLTTRSIRRIIESRLKAVGLKTAKITAHSLRHTSATIALMNGADLLSVKEMLRHANINTTLIYSHNLNRVNNGAEKAIDF